VGLPDRWEQPAFMQAMLDRGISTRRGIMNSHLEKAYMGTASHRIASGLGNSVKAQNETVILPLFTQMTDVEILLVVEALRHGPVFPELATASAG
jgi:dTDP-4-amino-4,6-dideoxygalactose transaminase